MEWIVYLNTPRIRIFKLKIFHKSRFMNETKNKTIQIN